MTKVFGKKEKVEQGQETQAQGMVAGSSGVLQVFIRTLSFPLKEIGNPSRVLSNEVTLIYIRIILIVGLEIVLGSWVEAVPLGRLEAGSLVHSSGKLRER